VVLRILNSQCEKDGRVASDVSAKKKTFNFPDRQCRKQPLLAAKTAVKNFLKEAKLRQPQLINAGLAELLQSFCRAP